jgi:glycosyltransferase involved in cell wall biosynthesis
LNEVTSSRPAVTIGMPVYNGEQTLLAALDSILCQTFTDFELLISDNASSDATESICREYAARDRRIRYVRQEQNIGATANFKYVLEDACGEYFMWAASDDVRSPDFIEVNVNFLAGNPEYVASASPNGFEGTPFDKTSLVNFALEGDVYSRFVQFFDNCWLSHGIFYSLVRTDVLRGCDVIGQSFIAADWAIDLYLARCGKVHRTTEGHTIFGVRGVSRGSDAYKVFRNSLIELPFPFYRLTIYTFALMRGFSFRQRARIMCTLVRLNLGAAFDQSFAVAYRWYCRVIKSGSCPAKKDVLNANGK